MIKICLVVVIVLCLVFMILTNLPTKGYPPEAETVNTKRAKNWIMLAALSYWIYQTL